MDETEYRILYSFQKSGSAEKPIRYASGKKWWKPAAPIKGRHSFLDLTTSRGDYGITATADLNRWGVNSNLFAGSGIMGIPFGFNTRCNSFSTPFGSREWLVSNVNGLGYKEASHFLRNIGMGEKFAILDRHILRNLNAFGVIESIPAIVSKKRYLQIEECMTGFAEDVQIPLSHLDLLFWYKEVGEVFK